MKKIRFQLLIENLIKKRLYPELGLGSHKDYASREKIRISCGIEEFRDSDGSVVPACLWDESTDVIVKRVLIDIVRNEEMYDGKIERTFFGKGKSKYFYHNPNGLLAGQISFLTERSLFQPKSLAKIQ